MRLRAYLDNNATTRLAPEALAAMTPYLTDLYLNPSSAAGELFGAHRPLGDGRRQLARLLGAPDLADNVVLTSGASEANSWAVHIATAEGGRGHIVASAIEHPSLIAALEARREAGWAVELVSPDETGRLSAAQVAQLLRPETQLVSVMLANNETGVLQPVAEIGRLVRARSPEALLHVDATQALGRIEVDFDGLLGGADLVSLSGHKLHGPKGIGALVANHDVPLPPLIHGSQESGRRGGTPDAAAAAGIAVAARLAADRLAGMTRVAALRDLFEQDLLARLPHARVLGDTVQRLPNTSAFVVPGLDAQAAVEALALDGIVIATGAACASGSPAPSHVLLAMGLDHEAAKSTLRVSLSHETNEDELSMALEGIARRVRVEA